MSETDDPTDDPTTQDVAPEEEGFSVPFSSEEFGVLIRACVRGYSGGAKLTEFQAREFLLWAKKVYLEHQLLVAILADHYDVSDIRHSVDETCEFMLAKAKS